MYISFSEKIDFPDDFLDTLKASPEDFIILQKYGYGQYAPTVSDEVPPDFIQSSYREVFNLVLWEPISVD